MTAKTLTLPPEDVERLLSLLDRAVEDIDLYAASPWPKLDYGDDYDEWAAATNAEKALAARIKEALT